MRCSWTYGQNHPAYNFNGCSSRCLSTTDFAGPVASGWMSESGWDIVVVVVQLFDMKYMDDAGSG